MTLKPLNPKDAQVLVVEDSPNDQQIISRALKTYGIRHWQVTSTASDALREVARRRYDVALIDYYLPGMNGLDLVRHLMDVSPGTKIIVMTGARQESLAVSAMKLGASDYISKDDFLTSAVVRALQAALRARNDEVEDKISRVGDMGEAVETEMSQASWLMRALDFSHGFTFPKEMDELGDSLTPELVSLFEEYIRQSCVEFPQTALELQEGVIRSCMIAGLSPKDVMRLYLAALINLGSSNSREITSAPLSLFLTCILARLLEEHQLMLSTSFLLQEPLRQKDAA